MGISDVHNKAMKYLNNLIGWDDVFINLDGKRVSITGLVSKNKTAYMRSGSISTKDYKVCKLFVDDIIALNASHNLEIPVPNSSLKNRNASIVISNGNPYQIKVESTGSFNGRKIWILEIERDI